MAEIRVADASAFDKRDKKVVTDGTREIGVFRLGDEFFAYDNRCAHAGGPVCQGRMINRVEEVIAADKTSRGFRFSRSQVNIVCPWHGYEYDIRTGCHQGNAAVRLKAYKVSVRDGSVYVSV